MELWMDAVDRSVKTILQDLDSAEQFEKEKVVFQVNKTLYRRETWYSSVKISLIRKKTQKVVKSPLKTSCDINPRQIFRLPF